MSRLSREWEELYRKIKACPFELCKALGGDIATPTEQQAQILRKVKEETFLPEPLRKKRIAAKSGKGTGKTTVSCVIGLWRTLQDVDRMTVVTAPTAHQLHHVWIAELRRLMETAHPILRRMVRIYKTKVEIARRPNWTILTRTAAKPEAAQGLHDKGLTVILEEPSGIERDIVEPFESTLTNKDSLLVAIGNPNSRDSAFFDFFNRYREYWNLFTLNAMESPIVDQAKVALAIREYGMDSDYVRVNIRGEFPFADARAILDINDVEACTLNDQVTAAMRNELHFKKALAYDFARFGGDENVIGRRHGLAVMEWAAHAHMEPGDLVDIGFRMQHEAGWRNEDCWHVGDATGLGQGVLRQFYQADKNIHEFHNGGNASNTEMYCNMLTEAWFGLRRLVKRRLAYLPNDPRLIQQLVTRNYGTDDKTGRLKVEPKEAYMKRGHKSPDRADMLVMLYYDEMECEGQVLSPQGGWQIGNSLR